MVFCIIYYQVKIWIYFDGLVYREVYVFVDFVFMVGDLMKNFFMFFLDFGWVVICFDFVCIYNYFGEEGKINVCVGREEFFVSMFVEQVYFKDLMYCFLVIFQEILIKYFCWFYIYYIYIGIYLELVDKGFVFLKNYLNELEQKFWFQGDDIVYCGMNGLEMKELFDWLEKKFYDWYN